MNEERSYLEMFSQETLNKYGLSLQDQKKIVYLLQMGIEKHLYTDTKDFYHDLKHIEKVLAYTQMILNKMGNVSFDKNLLLEAALFHDIGKTLGFSNKDHGIGGALNVEKYVNGLNPKQKEILKILIEYHASEEDKITFKGDLFNLEEQEEIGKMLDILKDADALDRNRLNFPAPVGTCDKNKLRTKEAKELLLLSDEFYMDYNLAIIKYKEQKGKKQVLNNYELLNDWIIAYKKGEKNMYHASLDPSIFSLEPKESTQKGRFVYAGINPVNCFEMASFRTSALFPRSQGGIKEIFPDSIFNTLKDKYITIYKLPKEKFREYKELVTSAPNGEWVSEEKIIPEAQVSFKALDLLKYFKLTHLINISEDYSFESQFTSFLKSVPIYLWGIKNKKENPLIMDQKWHFFSETARYYFQRDDVIELLNFVRKDVDEDVDNYINEFQIIHHREPNYEDEKECLAPLIKQFKEKYFSKDDMGSERINKDYLNVLCTLNHFPFEIKDNDLKPLSKEKEEILKRTRKISGYVSLLSIVLVTLFLGMTFAVIFILKR